MLLFETWSASFLHTAPWSSLEALAALCGKGRGAWGAFALRRILGLLKSLCGANPCCLRGPDCSMSTLILVPEGPAESLGISPVPLVTGRTEVGGGGTGVWPLLLRLGLALKLRDPATHVLTLLLVHPSLPQQWSQMPSQCPGGTRHSLFCSRGPQVKTSFLLPGIRVGPQGGPPGPGRRASCGGQRP